MRSDFFVLRILMASERASNSFLRSRNENKGGEEGGFSMHAFWVRDSPFSWGDK